MEELKIGDKFTITYGFKLKVAEIIDIEGNLIQFKCPFDGLRITPWANFFRYYMTDVEIKKDFEDRIIT